MFVKRTNGCTSRARTTNLVLVSIRVGGFDVCGKGILGVAAAVDEVVKAAGDNAFISFELCLEKDRERSNSNSDCHTSVISQNYNKLLLSFTVRGRNTYTPRPRRISFKYGFLKKRKTMCCQTCLPNARAHRVEFVKTEPLTKRLH
eukprot:SAG31_NODE_1447_length_8308_cov_58.914881_5_plen_146_part_00